MTLTIRYSALAIVLATCVLQAPAQAQSSDTQAHASRGPWSWSVRGGAAHQFATDLDGGGEFSVNRMFIEPGVRYIPGKSTSIAFTVWSRAVHSSIDSSAACFRGMSLPRRQPPSEVMIVRASQSMIRSDRLFAEKPANTTVWTAPMRAHASIATAASGTIGM